MTQGCNASSFHMLAMADHLVGIKTNACAKACIHPQSAQQEFNCVQDPFIMFWFYYTAQCMEYTEFSNTCYFFPTPPALPPAFFFNAGCLLLLAGSFRLFMSELFTVTGPKKLSSRPAAGQHNNEPRPVLV